MGRAPECNNEDNEAPPAPPPRRGQKKNDRTNEEKGALNIPKLGQSATLSSMTTAHMRSEAALVVIEQDSEEIEERQHQVQSARMSSNGSNNLRNAESDDGPSRSMLPNTRGAGDGMKEQTTTASVSVSDGASSSSLQRTDSSSSLGKAKKTTATLAVKQPTKELAKRANQKGSTDDVGGEAGVRQTPALQYSDTAEIATEPPSLRVGQRLEETRTPGAEHIAGQNIQRIDSIGTLGGNTTVASQQDRDYLVHAEIVQSQPDMSGPIVEAKLLEEGSGDADQTNWMGRKSRHLKIALVALILVVVGLTLGLVFGGGSGSNDTSTAVSPTAAGNTLIFTALLPDFLNSRSTDALMDPDSAQSKAVTWIESRSDVHDPMPNERLFQRFALASIYYSTQGQTWPRNDFWLTNEHECEWFSTGVQPCSGDDFVNLELVDNGLQGVIPDEIVLLSMLQRLDVGINSLSGLFLESPMDTLLELRLTENLFYGTLPMTGLLLLPRLEVLDISFNAFSDSFPSQIVRMPSLQVFDCTDNDLTGQLPTGIANLTSLEELICSDNPLSGSIPTQIGRVKSLKTLQLLQNGLSGSLPSELGNLILLRLLEVSQNDIEGPVPSQFSSLVNLEVLSLDLNRLSGTIPTAIGMMTYLTVLRLSENFFRGTIPTHIGLLTDLNVFDGMFNGLTGTIPSELGNLISLVDLSIYSNELSGVLPTEMGNLVALISIEIDNNKLTAPIPSELGRLTSLGRLVMTNNSMIDTMPFEVCALTVEHDLHQNLLEVDCEWVLCDCCFSC